MKFIKQTKSYNMQRQKISRRLKKMFYLRFNEKYLLKIFIKERSGSPASSLKSDNLLIALSWR